MCGKKENRTKNEPKRSVLVCKCVRESAETYKWLVFGDSNILNSTRGVYVALDPVN